MDLSKASSSIKHSLAGDARVSSGPTMGREGNEFYRARAVNTKARGCDLSGARSLERKLEARGQWPWVVKAVWSSPTTVTDD